MFICAGNQEIFEFATPMGVGSIEISKNLTRAILFDKPEEIIFVGTSGSYGNLKIFDIFETSSASQIELSFLEKKSYTPINNLILPKNNKNRNIIVNSSNYISIDEKLTKKFLDLKIEAENMEFFSVLNIAQSFDISVKGIFIITNYTNKNAHNDFIKNSEEAKKILTEYIYSKYKKLN
jgi:nucleoside phosphorylase